MCMFTGRIERVEATRIFARKTAPDRQLVVYEMKVEAPAAVAMVLPIPIAAGRGEDAVRFIALDHLPTLFAELDKMFDRGAPRSVSSDRMVMQSMSRPLLEVHAVGAFEASYVPTIGDFDRLDPRFRMPPGTLESIPGYADWGFAVFQLAATRSLAAIHPMAFEFPTRAPDRLFFPTVHVHDGVVHETADFSHMLYAQGVDVEGDDLFWQRAHRPMPDKLQQPAVAGLFDLPQPVYRCTIAGELPNTDTWARVHDRV